MFEPPEDPHRRVKAVTRYLIHLIHVIEALLFLAAFIVGLILLSHKIFLLLYLIPLIIVVLIIEICHLSHHTPPERMTSQLGIFNTLRGRGFIYQVAAALVISNTSWVVPQIVLGWTAWGIGVFIFILAILAREWEMEDWFEEPVKPSIALEESDTEDLVQAIDHPV